TFGVNLGSGVAPLDRFFLRPGPLVLSADVNATAINAGLNLGFLQANVGGGTIQLDTKLSAAINDPNHDGQVTLGELLNTPLGSLVNVTAPAASPDVNLPLQATAGQAPTA